MFGFDEMFDFNRDGKLDSWEEAVQFQFMEDMIREEERSCSGYNEDRDVFGAAGLDYDELEMMDPDERRDVLEEAGLDPDEYDF